MKVEGDQYENDTTLEADVENERVTVYNGDSVTGVTPSDSVTPSDNSVSDIENVALAISQSEMIADITTDFPWVLIPAVSLQLLVHF